MTFKPSRDKKGIAANVPLEFACATVFCRKGEGYDWRASKRESGQESLFVTLDDDDEADMIDGVAGGLKNENMTVAKTILCLYATTNTWASLLSFCYIWRCRCCMKFKKGGLYSLKNKLLKLRGTDGSSM